ncbi:MAG: hypothetical protein ACM3H8_11330, partial [Sphingobacteriales bacterium]
MRRTSKPTSTNSKQTLKKTIRLSFFVVLILMITVSTFAQENSLIEISGQVTDEAKKEAIPNVSVLVKGTVTGTVT